MESNNDNNGQGEQQLRKRKFNELVNDGQPATAGGEEENQPPEKLSKKKCGGQHWSDAFENLHLENFTREDLIQSVQKQLAKENEAHHKQLEAVKKEAEESAKQQAEMTTKMEELNKALLANQNKVEELTAEMENLKHQKHLDCAKLAEEFSKRIVVQLEQEKAEVQEDLGKKLAKIEEMHKEMEEKSEEVADKAKQIDALLMQLNESTSHQHKIGTTTEQEMKIQLSLETWFDWLALVPRHRLGKIVPKIGDRKFASIVQKFLHEYGEITINRIQMVAPYEEDPYGHPRVRAWQNHSPLRFEIAEAQMPANIKNFKGIELSYFDKSVLNLT